MQTDTNDFKEQLWMDEPAQCNSISFIQWKIEQIVLHFKRLMLI